MVDGVKAQGEVTASWLNVCQVDLRFSDTHTYTLTHKEQSNGAKQCQVIYDNALAAKTRRAAIKAKWLRPSQKSHINVKNLTIDASSSASCITSSCSLLRLPILKTSPVALCCSCSSLLSLLCSLPPAAASTCLTATPMSHPAMCHLVVVCVATAKIYAAFACKMCVAYRCVCCVCVCIVCRLCRGF